MEISATAEFVGIEIGGTKLQLVRGRGRSITERRQIAIEKLWGGEGIRREIAAHLPSLLTAQVLGLGVGFGGPVDWRTGLICCSHQVVGWSDFPLGSWLAERAHCPVFVDNDANVASLGEAIHGAGAGTNPVFYVTMGSGVGGGLTVEKRIYHGAKPGESEIGHLRLDMSGRIVESSCSGWGVDRKVLAAMKRFPDSTLARLAKSASAGQARFLAPAIAQGDVEATRILEGTAEDMAFALSHVTHLFHPETIVLGGGLSLAGEILRAAVAKALPRFLMEAFHPGPTIKIASLLEDAVPVGALTMAEQRLNG
jgi:glucokinase